MRFVLLLVAVIGAKASNLDIAFIVDGSQTICGDAGSCNAWDNVLKFIRDVVSNLEIGPLATKVALATFGDAVTLEWNLNGYTNKDQLDLAIATVKYPGGELKTQGLINAILNEIFNETAGCRSNASDVEVLITDGSPYINVANASANSAARQNKGVTVLVMCVQPGCDEDFAKRIASLPKEENKTYFLVDGYDSIDDRREDLLAAINAI